MERHRVLPTPGAGFELWTTSSLDHDDYNSKPLEGCDDGVIIPIKECPPREYTSGCVLVVDSNFPLLLVGSKSEEHRPSPSIHVEVL